MFKIGLKLWSSNKKYVRDAQRLYDDGVYRYIELFSEPGTFDDYINIWKTLRIPFVIHAPHFTQGLNFAKPENFKQNEKLAHEALRFADALSADIVIFHPGVDGDTKETVRQLKLLYDSRIIIENKPYCSIDGRFICNGYSPEEIKFIVDEVDISFCMDISHAICAANSKKFDQIEYLKKFLVLNPRLFHIADGDWDGIYDKHGHIGRGTFKLNAVLALLPLGVRVTLETQHDFKDTLDDFKLDVDILKAIIDKIEDQEIYFLRANAADTHDLYALANDAEVRKNSLSQAEIPWNGHVSWFNEQLSNKGCVFYVIRNKSNMLIGQTRFDEIRGDGKIYVVNFSLAKDFRGCGLGAKLLRESIKMLRYDTSFERLTAYIKKENQASLKSFLKVGFNLLGEEVLCGCKVYKLQFSWVDEL